MMISPLTLSPVVGISSDVGVSLVGGDVASVTDRSGHGFHAAQSNASKRPTMTTLPNGRPAIRFDGLNDFLRCATGTISSPQTVMLCCADNTNPAVGFYCFFRNTPGHPDPCIYHNGGKLKAFGGSEITGPDYVGNGTVRTYGAAYNNLDGELLLDGVSVATGAIGSAPIRDDVLIGCGDGGAWAFAQIDLCEFWVFHSRLTAAQMAGVSEWFRSRWIDPPSPPIHLFYPSVAV